MKPLLLYFAETLLVGGVLWGFWRVALRGKVAHVWSRRYLVVSVLLTALLPALDIPLYPATAVELPTLRFNAQPEAADFATVTVVAATDMMAADTGVTLTTRPAVDWAGVSAWVYVAVALFFGVMLAIRIFRIGALRRRAHLTRFADYTLACHATVRTPFSFLRTIFLGEGLEGRSREVVLMHEQSHVRHRHSWERIVVEIVCNILWFNPFMWLTARSLVEVQECEADADVLFMGCDMREYRLLILNQLFGYNPDIACGFGNSLTKNRFIMMTRSVKHRHAALRLGAAIPVVAVMMLLCSFTTRTPEPPAAPAEGTETVTSDTSPATRDLKIVEIKLLKSGGMTLDGDFTLESLADAKQRGEWIAVRITAEDGVKMGSITDLKETLRKLKLYRVQYASADGKDGQTRMLPPTAGENVGDVNVLPLSSRAATDNSTAQKSIAIERRNIYQVDVNSRGKCLAGARDAMDMVDIEDLTAGVKRFLQNPDNDANLSKSMVCDITLPDGRKEHYPVSEGVVTIFCAVDTPYSAYLDAQRAVGGAFEELRDELARKWFGRGYRDLKMAERDVVAKAVPIKISEAEPRN